ncbi:hypothetical protein ON010_g10518 [Phytophthora cinnamomi]|nr:hypothetical protein ON010_g10518 [Phytophthora cinnamomi]
MGAPRRRKQHVEQHAALVAQLAAVKQQQQALREDSLAFAKAPAAPEKAAQNMQSTDLTALEDGSRSTTRTPYCSSCASRNGTTRLGRFRAGPASAITIVARMQKGDDGECDASERDATGGAPDAAPEPASGNCGARDRVSPVGGSADAAALHERVLQHQEDGLGQAGGAQPAQAGRSSDGNIGAAAVDGPHAEEAYKQQMIELSQQDKFDLNGFYDHLKTAVQQMKAFMAILDSMEPEYRENPRLINGKVKRKISEKAGHVRHTLSSSSAALVVGTNLTLFPVVNAVLQSPEEINNMLRNYEQLSALHIWLVKRVERGLRIPETMAETTELVRQDPTGFPAKKFRMKQRRY